MIIYGTRGKYSADTKNVTSACQSCGKMEISTSTLFQYFHVYWIPFIPFSREKVSECAHCNEVLVGNEVPQQYGGAVERFPLHHFVGLFLLLIFVGGIGWSIHEENRLTQEYLSNPKVGDFYVLKDAALYPDAPYSEFQIVKILEDSNYIFREATVSYSESSKVLTLINHSEKKPKDYYFQGLKLFNSSDLNALHTKGTIYRIVRLNGVVVPEIDVPATGASEQRKTLPSLQEIEEPIYVEMRNASLQ